MNALRTKLLVYLIGAGLRNNEVLVRKNFVKNVFRCQWRKSRSDHFNVTRTQLKLHGPTVLIHCQKEVWFVSKSQIKMLVANWISSSLSSGESGMGFCRVMLVIYCSSQCNVLYTFYNTFHTEKESSEALACNRGCWVVSVTLFHVGS